MKRSDAKKILKGKKKLISLVRSMSSGKKGVITISWELNGAAYSLNKLCLKNYNCIPLKLISKLHILLLHLLITTYGILLQSIFSHLEILLF